MATAVLESEVVRLAQAVLGGGEHRHARATELAARVLDAAGLQATPSRSSDERSGT